MATRQPTGNELAAPQRAVGDHRASRMTAWTCRTCFARSTPTRATLLMGTSDCRLRITATARNGGITRTCRPAYSLLWVADSTGRCNDLPEHLSRSLEVDGLPGSDIQRQPNARQHVVIRARTSQQRLYQRLHEVKQLDRAGIRMLAQRRARRLQLDARGLLEKVSLRKFSTASKSLLPFTSSPT